MFAYFHHLAFQVPPAEFPPLLSCQLPHCFACAPFSSWYRSHLSSPWATPPWFLPGGWSFFQSTSPVLGRPPRLIRHRPHVRHRGKHFTWVLSSHAYKSSLSLELPILGLENEFEGAKSLVSRENHSPHNSAAERHSRSPRLSDSDALF